MARVRNEERCCYPLFPFPCFSPFPWKGEMVVCKSAQLKLEPKELLEEKMADGQSEGRGWGQLAILSTQIMLNQKQDLFTVTENKVWVGESPQTSLPLLDDFCSSNRTDLCIRRRSLCVGQPRWGQMVSFSKLIHAGALLSEGWWNDAHLTLPSSHWIFPTCFHSSWTNSWPLT